jgi:RNA polymerase sigma-70 factor, ECF subfamily
MQKSGGEDVTPRLMQAGKAEAVHGPEASDAELVSACTRADAQAFAVLLGRHQAMVRRVAWRLGLRHADVDDVAQETFLKLWNNPGQIRDAAALKGWLVRVASNLVMDRFRKKPMDDLEAAEHVSDGAPAADDVMERDWAASEVDLAIKALPDRQRLALTLVHFEQMGNIAAAAAMELSVDALESLLARARRGLKERLKSKAPQLLAAVRETGGQHG